MLYSRLEVHLVYVLSQSTILKCRFYYYSGVVSPADQEMTVYWKDGVLHIPREGACHAM